MRKMFYLLLVFMLVLFACSAGCTSSTTKGEVASAKTSPTPTAKQVSFQDKLKSEITDSKQMYGVDIAKVKYEDRTATVWMYQDIAWSKEQMRNNFIYTSFDVMSVLVKYSDNIDYVYIAGVTELMDTKGNKENEIVFQVETTMEDAKTVKWENMILYKDVMIPINSNFNSVYIHSAIKP